MNKRLEIASLGISAIVFCAVLLIKDGVGFYQIMLGITGIMILIYGAANRKKLSDFDDPEKYDERDELIQNQASGVVLTILIYLMLIALLINSFAAVPLNYMLVSLIALAMSGKWLVIKLLEKFNDQ